MRNQISYLLESLKLGSKSLSVICISIVFLHWSIPNHGVYSNFGIGMGLQVMHKTFGKNNYGENNFVDWWMHERTAKLKAANVHIIILVKIQQQFEVCCWLVHSYAVKNYIILLVSYDGLKFLWCLAIWHNDESIIIIYAGPQVGLS